MKTILEEPNVSVYLNEQNATIVVDWKGEATFPQFQFANDHALLFAAKGGIKKILLNQALLKNPDYKTRSWSLFSFLPRVFKELGFNAKVAVIPADTESSFTKLLAKIQSDILVHISDDSKEANQWLDA
ncbi:hypothetical protein R9C00_15755 [Flammeovirgaceae bacterium SG7u.111]|nr:hypothetical protein [Flammeovirgaceae bacterium SG7u.132]WPO33157.1 hypothetical protein R9C00_15755 [Flammeovirgaceae bacterium SG7u.111]